MSDPKDKDSNQPPASSEPEEATDSDKRSGRVAYDERGNAVWEWQLETGVYSRDVSTQRLKKLELDDLSIAETGVNKPPSGLGGQKPPMPGGGFNPYDNSPPTGGGSDPYDKARMAGKKFQPAQPQQRKPAGLQKLQEWMKLKKRVQENKDE